MMFLACSLVALIGCSVAFPKREFDCSGKEGQVWWGCGSFGVCTGGRHVQQDCLDGTRYDRRSQGCVNANQAAFPCNTNADCSSYYGEGHRFVERGSDPVENLPSCSFYYTCAYGRFLGHQQCNDGTVFDETSQLCKTADLVPPPCGNYSGPTERPPFSQVRQTINNNRFPNNNNNNRINNNNNNRLPNNNNNQINNNNQFNNRFPNNNNNNGRIIPATQRPTIGNELYGRRYPYRNLFRGTNRYSTYNNGNYNNGRHNNGYYHPRRFNPSLLGVAVDEFNQGTTSQELELESEA